MDSAEALNPLSTTSARMEALRLRSANKLILRALLAISSATLLLRVFGLGMQVVVTSQFGASSAMDAYLVASMVPGIVANLMVNVFAGSVTPIFARVSARSDRALASRLFSTMLNLTLLIGGALTLLMFVLRNQVAYLSGPGLNSSSMATAVSLAVFVVPTLFLLTGLGFLEAIFNAEGQFGWPAYAGIAVPIVTMGTVLALGKELGITSLAVGTLLGLGVKAVLFLVRLRGARLRYQPIIDLNHPLLGSVGQMAWLILLGDSVGLMSPLIDQIFASTLSAGSVSAISYASKLISVPVGVIFMAAGRAAMPYLSRQAGIGNTSAFKSTLRLYLWVLGLATLAVSVVMLVFAPLIVRILFQRGAFSASATEVTARTLQGFAIGLVPMALGFLLAQAFSALRMNKLLMFTSIFSAGANAVLDAVFAHFWQSFGIALATSAVYCCTLVILLVALARVTGGFNILTPPTELANLARQAQDIMEEPAIVNDWLPEWWRRGITVPAGVAVAVAGALTSVLVGVAVAVGDAKNVFKVGVGVPLMALLIYTQYGVLVAWALLDVFVGSTIAFFNGNNLDTALTLCSLLVILALPLITTFQRMPALTFLLGFLLWALAGIELSPLDTVSFLKLWGTYADFVLVAILAINLVTTRQRLLWLMDAMIAIGVLVSLYGIYGYRTLQNVSYDPSTGNERILSIFSANPTLALYLSLLIPVALFRAVVSKGVVRWLELMAILIMLMAIALTFSRGALITVPLCMVMLVLLLPNRRLKRGLIGAGAAVSLVAIFVGVTGIVPVFDRFGNSDIGTLNGRTYLWSALFQHFDPTHFFGYGLRAADTLLTSLQLGANGEIGNGLIATAPSNLFIGVLYDTGIVGLVLLVMAFLTLGWSLVRKLRTTSGEQRLLCAVALVTLFSVLLQSIEVDDLLAQGVGIYFWIIVALPFAACWLSPASQTARAVSSQPVTG